MCVCAVGPNGFSMHLPSSSNSDPCSDYIGNGFCLIFLLLHKEISSSKGSSERERERDLGLLFFFTISSYDALKHPYLRWFFFTQNAAARAILIEVYDNFMWMYT